MRSMQAAHQSTTKHKGRQANCERQTPPRRVVIEDHSGLLFLASSLISRVPIVISVCVPKDPQGGWSSISRV